MKITTLTLKYFALILANLSRLTAIKLIVPSSRYLSDSAGGAWRHKARNCLHERASCALGEETAARRSTAVKRRNRFSFYLVGFKCKTWSRMYKIVSYCNYLFIFFFQNNELFFVENWPKLFGPEQNYVGKWRWQFCSSVSKLTVYWQSVFNLKQWKILTLTLKDFA